MDVEEKKAVIFFLLEPQAQVQESETYLPLLPLFFSGFSEGEFYHMLPFPPADPSYRRGGSSLGVEDF